MELQLTGIPVTGNKENNTKNLHHKVFEYVV